MRPYIVRRCVCGVRDNFRQEIEEPVFESVSKLGLDIDVDAGGFIVCRLTSSASCLMITPLCHVIIMHALGEKRFPFDELDSVCIHQSKSGVNQLTC